MLYRILAPAAVMAAACAAAACCAKPNFPSVLERAYSAVPNSALARARCLACHAPPGPPSLNVFGAQVRTRLRAESSASLTVDTLHALAEQDADGDGALNGAELAAGTLPGDSSSRPSGATPRSKRSGSPVAPRETEAATGAGFAVPAHSFHPLIVHFPIGLFVFGALLEMAGARRRQEDLLWAGFLNRCAGALCGVPTVATGALAFWRTGYTLSPGLPPFHMVSGICAAILMLASAAAGIRLARAGRPRSGKLYWLLLGAALVAVLLAGHLGSLLVYS